MYILKNGTISDDISNEMISDFYIQVIDEHHYEYPNDSIIYLVTNELISSRNKLIEKYFGCYEEYLLTIGKIPIMVCEGGLYSSLQISKSMFEEMLHDIKKNTQFPEEIINKYLYLSDIDFILESVQNLVLGLNNDLIQFFVNVSDIDPAREIENDGCYEISGEKTCILSALIGSYFTKLGSILDLITKYAFEFENYDSDYSIYRKLKSAKILYGDKGRLQCNNCEYTLFNKDEFIRTIESIRNEVIHNGSLEHTPKVYCILSKGITMARFMLFPDIEKGNFTRYINRYHFFHNDERVNDRLPEIHIEFLKRLILTLFRITNPESDRTILEEKYNRILDNELY